MSPWLVRNILYPAHERLVGRPSLRYWRELERSQWLSADELRAVRQAKLRALLAHAWQSCPAHRERLREAGFCLESLAHFTLEDLPRLPLLDKDTIRGELQGLVAWNLPGGVFRYTTGGSTGAPLIFYFDRRRQAYDQAARMRTHAWFGVLPGEREVYLWGAPVELGKQDRLKMLRDRLTNQLLLSAFEMSPHAMRQYLSRIDRFKPACLFGYPSSLATLAEFARGIGWRPRRGLKAVFPTGEQLYPHQRQGLADVFDAPLGNCYGSRDAGFIAHECPAGSMHVTAENIMLEVIDADGAVLPPGETGELVVTHLDNYALPFVRYRTGDAGRLVDGACRCGRKLPLMQVTAGRVTDQLRRADGAYVHALALIYTVRDLPGVREFKIRQRALDQVRLELVVDDDFDLSAEERIRREFASRLGQGAVVEIDYVAAIAPEPSGKHRYVISEIRDLAPLPLGEVG